MDNCQFVDFKKYCKTCKNEKLRETKNPCNECLDYPINEGTSKPVKWEDRNGTATENGEDN